MKKFKNWQRYILQWGVLVILVLFISGIFGNGTHYNPEAFCPFGGIQAFANYVSHNSLPCEMSSSQIFAGIAIIVAAVLFSKLFCAYICPLGTSVDLLMKLRKRCRIRPWKIHEMSLLDKALRIVKYILLFWIMYNTIGIGELFCKKLDPYYAIATGFKGELSLYMSLGMLFILIVCSFFVDNFWCRYICPLGALSNTFKYWLWIVTGLGIVYIAGSIAGPIPLWLIMALFCIVGYMLEILSPKASMQILNVQRNNDKCSGCRLCENKCPYHINITSFENTIESVDCMLCGECVENCPSKALHIGFRKKGSPNKFNSFFPFFLTIVITICVLYASSKVEFPTINEYWGLNNEEISEIQSNQSSSLSTFTINGLNQIHCYMSSKTFMEKLKQIEGVCGVKTYAKHHRATITYKPQLTSPEKIQQDLFVPSTFQISRPDFKSIPQLRVLTIRTEKMTSNNSVNLLGLQFKQNDSLVYGLETKWDIPMIVQLYVDPSFNHDESWIKDVVTRPFLELTNAKTGKTAQIPMGYEFIQMEHTDSMISTVDFLNKMFKPFKVDFSANTEACTTEKLIYKIPNEHIVKPIISRNLPTFASYLSMQDGIKAVYTDLNDDCIPEIVIQYTLPMTENKLKELLIAEHWTIQGKDGIRTIAAPFSPFK